MKLRQKVIIGVTIISMLSILLFMSKNNILYNKVEENTINEIESGIAVYVATDTDYERVDSIPESGYIFNNEKSYCDESEVKNENIKISYDMNMKKISITPVANEKTKCYLYFEYATKEVETALGTLTIQNEKPDFSKTSCSSECGETTVGIYEVEDGMYGGTSYYFRGDTEDNYLIFAGFCWRIIRINGDGSIRIIYDGTTCHANGISTTDSIAVANVAYNASSDRSEYVGWSYTLGEQHGNSTPSNARIELEKWYTENLANYESYIADGKYCNDRSSASGYIWNSVPSSIFLYAPYARIISNKKPTLNCSNTNDIFILKVGLITVDEVSFAGGVSTVQNNLYYLQNGNHYWTMSPTYYTNDIARVFYVHARGSIEDNHVHLLSSYHLRPVINIRTDVTITGTGTIDAPYVVN